MAGVNGFLARWSFVGVADAWVLVLLYAALRERRIGIGHSFWRAYYIERDKNPEGYWFVVALYVAALIGISITFWPAGQSRG